MEAWSGITLGAVAATGNLKQLFPTWALTGDVALGARTPGQKIRRPMQGTLHSIQVRTDGTNGGYIEIWDVNGEDAGVDVSTPAITSTTPAITNAQLVALQARGLAKLIYRQDFVANAGAATPSAPPRSFLHGLAARFVGAAGNCELNLVVEHGFMVTV